MSDTLDTAGRYTHLKIQISQLHGLWDADAETLEDLWLDGWGQRLDWRRLLAP